MRSTTDNCNHGVYVMSEGLLLTDNKDDEKGMNASGAKRQLQRDIAIVLHVSGLVMLMMILDNFDTVTKNSPCMCGFGCGIYILS